ncbi:MAG: glycosyltransferase family 2 protein [Thermodesulfobacteriota bacterium]|nr:glycosyltransferase family 2 protein [Thermodesulfobacteriota bacterium]
MTRNKQLAVVVPAYKAAFLEPALESLSAQTDKRFVVYVGDDCSPENVGEICDRFAHHLDLSYRRFDENLGKKSLVAHWNRCIRLSSQPWICLFSDDDIMEPRCVEAFYRALRHTGGRHNLYRFDTLTIDQNGKLLRINPPHPELESAIQFAYHRLSMHRASFVSEYIFARHAFDRQNGMIDFPAAWCSDDASWIVFSGEEAIYTVRGPKVRWRDSALNITTPNATFQKEKIEADLEYMNWLNKHFADKQLDKLELNIQLINDCAKKWFYFQLKLLAPLRIATCAKLCLDSHSVWNDRFFKKLCRLISIHFRCYARSAVDGLAKTILPSDK